MGSMSRWLDVEVGTDDVELNTLPCNVAFADLEGDNEVKLIVGDLGRGEEGPKLKVFRGATFVSEAVLPGAPLGVAVLPAGEAAPRAPPLIAVAFPFAVFMYRNLKLFYKYYLPAVEVSTCETDIWKQLSDPANHNAESVARLSESLAAMPQKILCPHSVNFLQLGAAERLEYVEQGGAGVGVRAGKGAGGEVCALATLGVTSHNPHAAAALVVGTESGDVIVLETQSFTPLTQAKVCSTKKTPFQMVATGLYSVDYRITVATREKCICVLRRGSAVGRVLTVLPEHAVSIEVVPADNSVIVLCADNTLACYTKKGRRSWAVQLWERGVCACGLGVGRAALWLCAVALANGPVILYDPAGAATVRDSFFVTDVGSVLKFGQLGREEHVFVIITAGGNLMLKILKRTAEFTEEDGGVGAAGGVAGRGAGGPPWSLPKKSRLLIEQAHRERENATLMAGAFQLEMSRVRLAGARALLAAHRAVPQDGQIALTAEVVGLGPRFAVRVLVRNASTDRPLVGVALLFHVHDSNYKVSHPYIPVPAVSPGGSVRLPAVVEEVFPEGGGAEAVLRAAGGVAGGELRVLAVRAEGGAAGAVLVAARLGLPPTDPALLPESVLAAADSFTQADMEAARFSSPRSS